MSHFYFHLVTPTGREEDLLGSEFDTLEAAYLDATGAAVAMSSEMLGAREDPGRLRFEICAADQTLLIELPFSEVLRVPPSAPGGLSQELEQAVRLQQTHQALNADLSGGVQRARETLQAIRNTLGGI